MDGPTVGPTSRVGSGENLILLYPVIIGPLVEWTNRNNDIVVMNGTLISVHLTQSRVNSVLDISLIPEASEDDHYRIPVIARVTSGHPLPLERARSGALAFDPRLRTISSDAGRTSERAQRMH